MTRVLLAVGANLGDRAGTLGASLLALASLPHTRVIARSNWHETAPVSGPPGQPSFLNGAVLLDTSLPPYELAHSLRHVETQLGRERHIRWDARRIDIDLLLFGESLHEARGLVIPHPRMAYRRFVLDPACEVAGEMVHPTSGWTLAALQRHWQHSPHTVTVSPATDIATVEWLTQELETYTRDQDNPQSIELVTVEAAPAMVIELEKHSLTRGPVVTIASAERTVILQEAIAAIQAAWPE